MTSPNFIEASPSEILKMNMEEAREYCARKDAAMERISPGVTCRRSSPHIMRTDQAAGWFTAVRHERLLRRKEALERAAPLFDR